MWHIVIPSLGVIVLVRFVVRRSQRRTLSESQRIRERGYIALMEEPPILEAPPTHNQILREAYFAVKRERKKLEERERLVVYGEREVSIGRQSNELSLQQIELYKGKIQLELNRQQAAIEGMFKELALTKRELEVQTRESVVEIKESKLDALETVFQKAIRLEKSMVELAKKEFLLEQESALQTLREHGFVLREKELTLEAKQHGLVIREGMLGLRAQQQDNDLRARENNLELSKREYQVQMQHKENSLFLKLGELRNEKRAVVVERRSWQLKDEWENIVELGKLRVENYKQQAQSLKKYIWSLVRDKQRLEKKQFPLFSLRSFLQCYSILPNTIISTPYKESIGVGWQFWTYDDYSR